VVQCFVSDLVASVTPSVTRLRKFEKIRLKPGESRTVTFTLRPGDLAFVNRDNQLVAEPGAFEVQIGGQKAGFVLE
jgi:beta-glucosidase